MSQKKPALGRREKKTVQRPEDRQAVEAFTNDVEPATQATTAPAPSGWVARAKSGRKSDAYNFRFNESQRALLDHAHGVTGKPIQRLIEEAFWPALEDQYGDQVPIRDKE